MVEYALGVATALVLVWAVGVTYYLRKLKSDIEEVATQHNNAVDVINNHAEALEAIGASMGPAELEDAEGVPMGFHNN